MQRIVRLWKLNTVLWLSKLFKMSGLKYGSLDKGNSVGAVTFQEGLELAGPVGL